MFYAKRLAALAAVCAMLVVAGGRAEAAVDDGQQHLPYYLVMDPPVVYPGAIIQLQMQPPAGAAGGSVMVAGRRYLGEIKDGLFVVFFAVDIDTLPGPYELSYDVGSRHGSRIVTVRARRMDEEGRGEKGLTKEDLIVEELVRSNPRLVSMWNRTTLERFWNGAFATPVKGPMVNTFAMRRTSETSIGLPHTGVDLSPGGGAEVRSSGPGTVALVAEVPGSKIVAVDHGLGLYTYYVGLGEIFVDEGAHVRHGMVLGKMPESRRLLHFGARLAGAQVDPVSLPGIDLKVPAFKGEYRAPKEEKDRKNDYDY